MKYLDRLKTKFEKRLPDVLQKLQKTPYYSFCSTHSGHFQKVEDAIKTDGVPPNTDQAGKEIHPRLVGCKAYPSSGAIAGCPIGWCKRARGAWCGDCRWRSKITEVTA
jgi:hypothetical protein